MEFIVIIIVMLGIGFALYAFLSSSGEVKNKNQRENSIYELKQQVISQNVKLQKLEFERAGQVTETEKMKKELEAAKSELGEARANESAMREDLQRMRLLEDNNKSSLDLFKAENESLKEKLMERENEAKRLNDEVKSLNEKLKTHPAPRHKKENNTTESIHPNNSSVATPKDAEPNIQNKNDKEDIKSVNPGL